MEYTWDERKAEKVKAEHKVEFEKIVEIFEDVYAVEFIDEKHSTEKEIRYAIIGLTAEYGITFLVFTTTNDNEYHFITARKAKGWMVKEYENNRRRF